MYNVNRTVKMGVMQTTQSETSDSLLFAGDHEVTYVDLQDVFAGANDDPLELLEALHRPALLHDMLDEAGCRKKQTQFIFI